MFPLTVCPWVANIAGCEYCLYHKNMSLLVLVMVEVELSLAEFSGPNIFQVSVKSSSFSEFHSLGLMLNFASSHSECLTDSYMQEDAEGTKEGKQQRK